MTPWDLGEMLAASPWKSERTQQFAFRAATEDVRWASNPLGAYQTAPGANRHQTAKVNDESNKRKAELHMKSFRISLGLTSCRFLGFSPNEISSGEELQEKPFSICSGIVASVCFFCVSTSSMARSQALPSHANRWVEEYQHAGLYPQIKLPMGPK